MKNITYIFLFASALLLSLPGCRTYSLYHYKEIRESTLGGELTIEVRATRVLSEENGKKLAVENNPYSLLVKYFSAEKFSHIEVVGLTLVGNVSGNKVQLPSSSGQKSRQMAGTGEYFSIISFTEPLKEVELEYEEYGVTGVLYLHPLDGNAKKINLNHRLSTDFKTDRRSDFVDGVMSI